MGAKRCHALQRRANVENLHKWLYASALSVLSTHYLHSLKCICHQKYHQYVRVHTRRLSTSATWVSQDIHHDTWILKTAEDPHLPANLPSVHVCPFLAVTVAPTRGPGRNDLCFQKRHMLLFCRCLPAESMSLHLSLSNLSSKFNSIIVGHAQKYGSKWVYTTMNFCLLPFHDEQLLECNGANSSSSTPRWWFTSTVICIRTFSIIHSLSAFTSMYLPSKISPIRMSPHTPIIHICNLSFAWFTCCCAGVRRYRQCRSV